MSRTSTALKRLGVAAVAAVTVGAGLPLLAGSANAAVDTITVTGGDQTAGLGSCLAYSVSVTNTAGDNSTPTVTIRLSEDPGDTDTTREVQFCNTSGGTNVANPDNAEDAQAVFTTTRSGNSGPFTVNFGVQRTTEGGGTITAFNDLDADGRVDTGERVAAQRPRFQFNDVNTSPAAANNVVLTPETQTANNGSQSATFTATVRDNQGVAVQGATVTVTVNNGSVSGTNPATNTVTLTTDSNGQVSFRTQTPATGSGTQTVTVTIRNGASDSSTVTFQAASAPPTTVPPSSPAPNCNQVPTIVLERTTIIATGRAGYRITNAPANSTVQVFAYSNPNRNYRVVRTVSIGADGNGPGGDGFVPPTNTRLYAQVVGCDTDETRFSVVINVRTQISLNVRRNGPKNYTFSGRLLPARPGGLIASLYRVTNDGRQILTAQARANSSNGQYVINRRFTGNGRFGFVVRTGQDLQNAPGSSNVRSLLVF